MTKIKNSETRKINIQTKQYTNDEKNKLCLHLASNTQLCFYVQNCFTRNVFFTGSIALYLQ